MWAKNKQQNGFTIVELLIVIVVIGILAAITIVAYNGIQQKAKIASATSDLVALNRAIQAARVNENKTLLGITGTGCTSCSDTSGAKFAQAIDRISAASGANLSKLKNGDPWGNPYSMDENEGEGATPCASRDTIGLSIVQSGVPAAIVPFYQC